MLYETCLIYDFVRKVFPYVDEQLEHWRTVASQIPDPELRKQALASLADKRFHAQGGAIYALYPGLKQEERQKLIVFIVAYQTISDYLDNLCDRAGVESAEAFRNLHLAMVDALAPRQKISNYYIYYPFKNDGGYLQELVTTCQSSLSSPLLNTLLPVLKQWAALYSELQTNKHIAVAERDGVMKGWLDPLVLNFPGFYSWEIAAATGSTLGIFFLAALAKSERPEDPLPLIEDAYFPWVSAIHILLDYFIDRFEDEQNGDLNFVQPYKDDRQMSDRLVMIFRGAGERAQRLANSRFHILVLNGLLAMYLSDPKALLGKNERVTKALLASGVGYARFLYHMCKLLRRRGKI